MKTQQILMGGLLALSVEQCWSQGTFIYDQQSANSITFAEGGPTSMQNNQPIGQSFTPALSSVGFVQFSFYDSSPSHNQGGVVNIVLHSTSITGPILGTSDSVTLLPSTSGSQTFYFAAPVSVTPGATYFFQPILASGDQGIAAEFAADYTGGTAFLKGSPVGADLWFREGVLVVPEPSAWALLLLGGGACWLFRRRL